MLLKNLIYIECYVNLCIEGLCDEKNSNDGFLLNYSGHTYRRDKDGKPPAAYSEGGDYNSRG